MTTIQSLQHRTTLQGLRRYPITLQLRYRAESKLGSLHGFGRIRMMSSKDIVFASGDGLKPGMKAEIIIDWPRFLEGRIQLQLVLQVTISGSQDSVAEARIRAYDFRTRRPGEASKQIALQGGSSVVPS
jgi:hypothetical protein